MTGDDKDPADLARQAWIMYSVGVAMIAGRMAAQISRVGWRRLSPDDYVMLLSGCLYTSLIITLIRSVTGIGGNGVKEAQVAMLTPEEIQEHSDNAKFVNVAEHAMLCTIYSLKACMLIIYSRLTMGLKEQFAVKILAIYVALGFIASESVILASCVPYSNYWLVPVGDANINQCAFYKHYSVAQAVFNTTSDALMLAIPLPLLIRSHLPNKKKVAMVIIFGMGVFVILAAILSKAISLLKSNYGTITYAFWYLREASVAIYVANLPLLWPIIHKALSWFSKKTGYGGSSQKSLPITGDHELKNTISSRRTKGHRLPDDVEDKWDGNSSQNFIIDRRARSDVATDSGMGGGIRKEETFEITVSDSQVFGGHGQMSDEIGRGSERSVDIRCGSIRQDD